MLTDPSVPYGPVATGLNNGNMAIYQEGAPGCYCGYWAIVNQQGNTVVGKQTVQNTINTDSAIRLNLITLGNGNFVLSTRYSASALRSYVISPAGTVLKTIDHPFNYAQAWMRFRSLPTDFGFAVIYESQWDITYKYAAYDFAGNTLVAAKPVTTNTSSVFYNTNYNTGIDAAVGANKQIFLVSMPNSYPGSTSLMKLVYDNTGTFTPTLETSVGTVGQAGWGGNELQSWSEKQSAKGSQLAYLGYPDQGIAGSGPFATFADGTPRVDRLAGMKLNIYDFSSNTLTQPFQISLSLALRASGNFASNNRLYNDGIGNSANQVLHFSPSGHRLFFGTLMEDSNLSAIMFDTSDMSKIIPVTFKMRADNTPQDFGKRFFVWDVSDSIKKVEVTVTGGSNNTMSCVCSSTDLTGVPVGGTLIIQATGAGAKNITFTDALNSARLATDTPGERTVTVKATNAANVVSKIATFTVVVE